MDRKVLVGRARPLRKAGQLVQGNRVRMADQAVPVFRADRKVLAGRARHPREAGQLVQGNRMRMVYQVVPVFREDLEVQVDRKVLAARARARPSSTQGPPVVRAKVASPGSRRHASRILTCLGADSSRGITLAGA